MLYTISRWNGPDWCGQNENSVGSFARSFRDGWHWKADRRWGGYERARNWFRFNSSGLLWSRRIEIRVERHVWVLFPWEVAAASAPKLTPCWRCNSQAEAGASGRRRRSCRRTSNGYLPRSCSVSLSKSASYSLLAHY